ncbi:MAG: VCBS repeat-containing protein [Acidobacteria bacterium]|nr:VCBS repeat-containing protein [Acidobacteriota bacterium]
MSKAKSSKRARQIASDGPAMETAATDAASSSAGRTSSIVAYFRGRLWLVAVVVLLVAGVAGATLKYMEEDARRQNAMKPRDRSLLSAINPYVTSPSPTPAPQLSKEYIYAGSRLLAVEDANANAAPPADLAVWRPSTGVWWVLGGPGSQQTSFQWGGTGDKPVPGDFDGDGKTDFSIYRGSTGEWWIYRSSDNTSTTIAFGQAADLPAVGDYDGDGRSDAALYRGANGTWYITRSSDSSSYQVQFGLSSDVPAPGDFDGDGKADIAVYRSSNTTFYTYRSSDLTVESTNINSTGTPVPADYDGDGKANYAVRSGSDWKISSAFPNIITGSGTPQSSESVYTVSWQDGGDKAVQNDYDGDGIVDIAVWRDSNGTWYIRKSSDLSTRTEQWGTTGDIAVPALYRR